LPFIVRSGFGSFVYSADFFLKVNISGGTHWRCFIAHYSYCIRHFLKQTLELFLCFSDLCFWLSVAGMLTLYVFLLSGSLGIGQLRVSGATTCREKCLRSNSE
jgi:hypothetical protein